MKPYFEKDGITLYCGDNCDVLGTFARESIDLVVTSPPYDDLRTYGGHQWDFYGVAWQLKRVLKPGGVIVWVVNDETKDGGETGTSYRQALHFNRIGLRIHDTMIWRKESFRFPESNRCHPCFEFMFVFSKGDPRTFNQIKDRRNKWPGKVEKATPEPNANGEYRRPERFRVTEEFGGRVNVWDVVTQSINGHHATFPEDLARDHILSWSNEGDTVLDPFNGSGTTTKMARECGRKGIGIEINEEYCEIAKKRIEQGLLPCMAGSESA